MQHLYSGGLQIRSNDATDPFYNIKTFSDGDLSLHKFYPKIIESDIPIAQDCFGDQFLIREDKVIRLNAECGDIEEYEVSWETFLEWVAEDPVDRLELPDALNLEMGELLFAYPPFCTTEGENATIKTIDGKELILFHADFCQKLSNI